MNRADFLQRAAALVAAGVALDQLDLLERLTYQRRYVAGWRAPTIAYELKLLNSLTPGYTVAGANWRLQVDGFSHAAKLSGRDVRYDLVRDIYVVGEQTRQPWVFTPPAVSLLPGPGAMGGPGGRMGRF